MYTVFLAGKSPKIRSYTVDIYGSSQPYTRVYVCVCVSARARVCLSVILPVSVCRYVCGLVLSCVCVCACMPLVRAMDTVRGHHQHGTQVLEKGPRSTHTWTGLLARPRYNVYK